MSCPCADMVMTFPCWLPHCVQAILCAFQPCWLAQLRSWSELCCTQRSSCQPGRSCTLSCGERLTELIALCSGKGQHGRAVVAGRMSSILRGCLAQETQAVRFGSADADKVSMFFSGDCQRHADSVGIGSAATAQGSLPHAEEVCACMKLCPHDMRSSSLLSQPQDAFTATPVGVPIIKQHVSNCCR